jgi:YD repeat-containing protein
MTRFDYDPVGNLIKLTLPMGVYLSYRYDAAQRLTGISDSTALTALSSSQHFTYDALQRLWTAARLRATDA